ncbi:LysR substrate-binding domain-containing protein (plasmid) [Prescottella equi]|uniref:LysR substrate-binding domain-containing protein n=1 Tax=Rhodococcus hoagii TaxID=43767 RepID=UPI002577FDF9|nr:LysR substrate-binding domain-containing protein [Prescottella equi]WJJ14571.1 LysR substrate-binding domain-containing protein [Prescottella equi]
MPVAQEDYLSRDSSLTGRVRVIAPGVFGAHLLLPGLGAFQRQHPNLTVEVMMANRHASLTPREFDLAVMIESPQARAVTVRKLADYTLSFHASSDYLASHPPVKRAEDLYDHILIWYIDSALDHRTFNLLYEVLPEAHARIQTSNIAGFIQAAEAGRGGAPTVVHRRREPTFDEDRRNRHDDREQLLDVVSARPRKTCQGANDGRVHLADHDGSSRPFYLTLATNSQLPQCVVLLRSRWPGRLRFGAVSCSGRRPSERSPFGLTTPLAGRRRRSRLAGSAPGWLGRQLPARPH